jgi:hypothetical protein
MFSKRGPSEELLEVVMWLEDTDDSSSDCSTDGGRGARGGYFVCGSNLVLLFLAITRKGMIRPKFLGGAWRRCTWTLAIFP